MVEHIDKILKVFPFFMFFFGVTYAVLMVISNLQFQNNTYSKEHKIPIITTKLFHISLAKQ